MEEERSIGQQRGKYKQSQTKVLLGGRGPQGKRKTPNGKGAGRGEENATGRAVFPQQPKGQLDGMAAATAMGDDHDDDDDRTNSVRDGRLGETK